MRISTLFRALLTAALSTPPRRPRTRWSPPRRKKTK
jgi:hypothetical protein